jgi:hypothetical protein
MKNTFFINYEGTKIKVEYTSGHYLIILPLGDLELQSREDNEGAIRWFDIKTDQETPQSKNIGELIDLHIAQENA